MVGKAGYKQTDTGIIPEDWDCSKIGDYSFVTKLAGFEYTRHFDYSKSGSIIAVRGLNIKNGRLNLDDIHTIPEKTSDDLPRSKLKKGDLVMSYVGTLGRVAVIPENHKYHLAPNVAKLSVNRQFVSPEYLCHYLNSSQGQKSIVEAAASTTQAALSMRNLRGLFFVRPALAEQEAIAAALSDVDALIESLEQLLAKKRQVKQGAMQELLSGKRRLPGFSGVWAVKRLGDIAEIVSGGTPSTRIREYWDGDIDWCTPTDITGTEGKYLFHTEKRITEEGLKKSSANLLPKGTLLLCSRATIGEVRIATKTVCTNQGFKSLICSDQVYNEFLYYVILTLKPKLLEKGIGSTFLEISKKDTASVEIDLPPFEEQTAIAEILSEMDAEIAALDAKLSKARRVKEGMMQELLTGRVRLV
ncbi:MAG: restriction endonuclease subunit S [Bacteroidetes bacterium]|nr:restriction endonuclease subunit S [Bacteroidota bacterium]